MTQPFESVTFAHGPATRNRFMLSPLTNQQSHADGTLSDDEYRWLVMRAEGGFGITTTCASHVQSGGQGFPGQLGCFSDAHLEGLTRLAAGIKAHDGLALVQLHHAGMRAPSQLTGHAPVAPFDDPETGTRALSTEEIGRVVEAFVAAAERCRRAGFDGVELHGAHGYLLCQFLDPVRNLRTDGYGGSLEERSRILFEIVDGVRARCGDDFHLAVRLSPERFGVATADIVEVYRGLLATEKVDLVDLSLWDVFKEAIDPQFAGRFLLGLFTGIDRGATRLGAAGKIYSGAEVRRALDAGVDVVVLGRAAIANHDFPARMFEDPEFTMRTLPISADDLRSEGLGEAFIEYMRGWKGFVSD
jgi:2,4-dienoyl-CoA reductase-like NADH-dependent reductase (Old Yellow Enzyme family)